MIDGPSPRSQVRLTLDGAPAGFLVDRWSVRQSLAVADPPILFVRLEMLDVQTHMEQDPFCQAPVGTGGVEKQPMHNPERGEAATDGQRDR